MIDELSDEVDFSLDCREDERGATILITRIRINGVKEDSIAHDSSRSRVYASEGTSKYKFYINFVRRYEIYYLLLSLTFMLI